MGGAGLPDHVHMIGHDGVRKQLVQLSADVTVQEGLRHHRGNSDLG